jgi:predicted HTH domain antitoxin
MLTSERERRERLVIELYQEGKTYRDIAQTVRMSPNTMKAILSRAGLDQSTLNHQDLTNSSQKVLVDFLVVAKLHPQSVYMVNENIFADNQVIEQKNWDTCMMHLRYPDSSYEVHYSNFQSNQDQVLYHHGLRTTHYRYAS